jgi:hypothetical protein
MPAPSGTQNVSAEAKDEEFVPQGVGQNSVKCILINLRVKFVLINIGSTHGQKEF